MNDNALQYTIEVDDTPAQEGTARVNKAFDSVTDKATRSASQSETAFSSMTASIIAGAGLITSAFSAGGAAVGSFASYVFRAGEGALALSAAAGLVTAEMVKWTAANATAGNAMELLVNSWRAFELIATGFAWYAVAGVGVGLLAEETFKLVNARGKLIEQEAYFAASNKIGIGEVERSDTIAQLSGIPRADVRGALSSLKDQFSSNGAEVRSNLKEIGVPDYIASGGATTELLAEIAKRFDAIPDPVARANAAIVFFGKETAGKVLPELNGHFADAAKAADDWALGLSDKTRNQVFAFRQTLQELKTELMGFGVTFHAVTAAAEQAFVVAGAKVFDFVQSIRHAIGEFAPEPKTLLDLRTPPSLAEAERDTGFLLNKRLNEGPARAGDMATAVALRDEARAELARESSGKDALEAQLSRARGLKSEAEKKLDATARGSLPMSVPDTIAVSSAYVTTSREVTSLENQLDQLKNATEAENKTFEARKASRELVFRSFSSPDTGRDIRGEIEKMTTFTTTDREGRVHEERLRLDDETRRNIETAFRVFTLDLAKKNATAELKIEEEKIQKREQYEEKLFEKRLEYSTKIAEMEVATDDRTLSHQRELLTYSRDEQLGALAGTRPQTVAGKLAIEQRKLGIETGYISQNSVQESEGLDRQKSRELQDLAGKRYLNEIDDQTYFKGREAITRKYGEQGSELNDKFSHELITAQQNAANASTEIIRSAQEKEFSSLKQSVEGVLTAMETKSESVFSAIGKSLKAALLGALNEIVSSQIAAALFRVLNPGATVGFDGSVGHGKMGGFLGGLGLGTQPVFGGTTPLKRSGDWMHVAGYEAGPDGPTPGTDDWLSKEIGPNGIPEFRMSTALFQGILGMGSQIAGVTYSHEDLQKLASGDPVMGTLLKSMGNYKGPAAIYRGSYSKDPIVAWHERFHVGELLAMPDKPGGNANSRDSAFTDEEFSKIFGLDAPSLAQWKKNSPEGWQMEGPAYMFEQMGAQGKDSAETAAMFSRYYQAVQKKYPDTAHWLLDMANPDLQRQYAPSATPQTQIPAGLRRDSGMDYAYSDSGLLRRPVDNSYLPTQSMIDPDLFPGDFSGLPGADLPNASMVNPALFPALSGLGGGGSFVSGGEVLGMPSGMMMGGPGVISEFPVKGQGGMGSLGNLANLAQMKDLVYNSGSISMGPGVATTAAGISQSLGGGMMGSLAGGAAGFASSPMGGMMGLSLAMSGLQSPPSAIGGAKTAIGGTLLGANIGSHMAGLGMAGGAMVGAGAGLVADGLHRGGLTGTLEDAGGGALIGMQFGGPVGAVIGAAVGAGVGLVREFFFKGDRQHAKDLVKQVYGMSISDNMADQIVKIAKEDYGGEVDVAVRSQKVRDMLMLYAEGTGQKLPLSSMKPESASLAEVGGKAYQQTSLIDGQNYAYQSSMPVLGGYTPTIYPTAQNSQAVHLNVNLDRQATTDVFEGKITQTVNPGYVQGQYSSALNSSAGRLNNAAALAQPGLIIS